MAWLRPTSRAEKSIRAAYGLASGDGEGLAQSQHLLLALVQEPQSFSTLLLAQVGVSPQDLSAEVARLKSQDDPARLGAEPSEQAWAQNRSDLLEPARQAAQRLGDTHVGTEHLLLGLLRAEDAREREGIMSAGIAGHALRNLGVTWERLHEALPALQRHGPD